MEEINRSNVITESEVRKAMVQELIEWGITIMSNENHRIFHEKVLATSILYSKETSEESCEEFNIDEIVLSRDASVAIRQVLQHEFESSKDLTFWKVNDSLGFDFKPFYHRFDIRTESQVLTSSNLAKNFNIRQLDPFLRFSGNKLSAQEHFHSIFSLPSSPSLEGYVFEALVATHMVHHMKCEYCNSPSLYYNGGINASGAWADVVCKNCTSSYEIKSRPSNEKIEKDIFRHKSIRGGSFKAFHRSSSKYHTRYLVIVSRKATYNPSSKGSAHRVTLGRIRQVKPRLCSESFLLEKENMRIISSVSVDLDTVKKAWFFVRPYAAESHSNIAQEVFDQVYGDGTWKGISDMKQRLEAVD